MKDLGERLNHLPPEKQRYLLGMLPTHLADAAQTERLRDLLTNFDFIEAKVAAMGPQSLIDDYELSDDRALRAIQDALIREAHVLAERPGLLWQQLYNRLQWEDEPMLGVLIAAGKRRCVPDATPWFRLRGPLRESRAFIRPLIGHSHTGAIMDCAVGLDNSSIISACDDGTLRVWDAHTGQLQAVLLAYEPVFSCTVSPDGSFVVSGGSTGTLKIWNARTGQEQATLRGHQGEIWDCAVIPDASFVVSAGDGLLQLWDLQTGENATLGSHGLVRRCVVGPEGNFVVSAGWDGSVKMWDVHSRQELVTFKRLATEVNACAMSSQGLCVLRKREG